MVINFHKLDHYETLHFQQQSKQIFLYWGQDLYIFKLPHQLVLLSKAYHRNKQCVYISYQSNCTPLIKHLLLHEI